MPSTSLRAHAGGPPGQVNAVAGPKKSMKDQGELQGVLADMGYTADQVRRAVKLGHAFGWR